jgi:hypothetical protein
VQAGASTKLVVPNLPVLAANEVFAAPVQAGASTGLPVLTASRVLTPVQAGVGTKFFLEEAAGSSFQFPISTTDEVFAAPVQVGASTKLPVLTADDTKFILEEAAGS